MKKVILGVLVIASIIGCKEEKKEKAPLGSEVRMTTGIVVINVATNQYSCITLERTIKDSAKMVVTDSTAGETTSQRKTVRDTSYRALWPITIPDSTGKVALKGVNGKDSIQWSFVPISKDLVLLDLNRDWK